jgi:HAD superfamily hydrolase (TIGR01490 family)
MTLAIFDLDGTLINGQSQKYLIDYFYKNKLISRFDYFYILTWFVGYKLGFFNDPRYILEYAFKIIKGKDVVEMNKIMKEFYDNSLQSFLNLKVVGKLIEHQDQKDKIFIVSNAVKPLVEVVSRELGVENIIATELQKENGLYTGRIKGEIVYGAEKVKRLQEIFSEEELKESCAYADHRSDIDLLKIAKHPFLVNPSKKTKAFYNRNFLNKNVQII